MDYVITAILMRAVRLFAFLLSMGIMQSFGPSLWRWIRNRAPDPALVSFAPAISVAIERDRSRAIWAILAFGVFTIQLRWLTPWLPELQAMRVLLLGISIINGVMLVGIFHHGRADPRFKPRRAAATWAAVLVLCLLFAVTSR